jgi:hypothetical protein
VEATTGPLFQGAPLRFQELDHSRPDGTEAQEPEANLSHEGRLSA